MGYSFIVSGYLTATMVLHVASANMLDEIQQ
jgi:hypothetical protein